MRFQILSDLHLDFHQDSGISFLESLDPGDTDVLLIAGDFGEIKAVEYMEKRLGILANKYPMVVYTPGNHEYYKSSPHKTERILQNAIKTLPNVKIPINGIVELENGKRIIGGTMWFPFRSDNDLNSWGFNDFRLIDRFVPWVCRQNEVFLELLEDELKEGDIVLTHHAPSALSLDPEHEGSRLNRFYYTDGEVLVKDRKPAMWVHGHIHCQNKYRIGDTLVVSNPLGYPHETRSFVDKMLVDL